MAITSQGPQLAQTLQEFKAWIDSLSDRDKINIVHTARSDSSYYSRGGRTRLLWNAYTHQVEPKAKPGETTMYGFFNYKGGYDAQRLEAFEEWTDDAVLRFTLAQQCPHHNTAYKEGKMILRDLDKADILKCVELDKPVRREDLVARLNLPGYGLTEALCYCVSSRGDLQKRMRSTEAIGRALRVWLRLSARDAEVRRLLLEVEIDWSAIVKSYEEEDSNAKVKVQWMKEQLAGHILQLAILRNQLDQIQPILKRIAQDVLRMKNGKVSCGFDVALYAILRKGGLDPHLPVVSAGLDLDWTLDLLERADLVLDLIKDVELVRVSGDKAILDQKPPKLHKRGLPKARLVLRQEQVNAIRALEPVAEHLAAVSPNASEHLDFYVRGLADGSILAD